jgi:peptidoglycan/xylan/chitin deacetylase (PgdA/CDA1 family)
MKNPGKFSYSRVFKLVISAGVFALTNLLTWLGCLFGKVSPGTCVVLYYHSIPPDQRTRFAKQLDVLLCHRKPIGVSRRIELRPGLRYAGITFDDAFENFFHQALPELKKRNIPATVFVIADALDKSFGPPGYTERVMSLEQLRSMPAELVSVGSHTVTHPMMPLLSEEEARTELIQSRRTLEELLSRPVPTFSFPYGGFSRRLTELCREAGYERIFTTLPVFAFAEPGEFVVGRVRVDPTDWPLEFRLKLAGAYRWLPAAFAFKRLIVSPRVLRLLFGQKGQSDRATIS